MRHFGFALAMAGLLIAVLAPLAAAAQTPRLVVFESFTRSTCGICASAGRAIDVLAEDYGGAPVVFIDQGVDHVLGARSQRFWAAYGGGGSATLPLIIVDSGHQVSNGQLDFDSTYRALIDAELARPPEAVMEAYSKHIGDQMHVYALATSLGSATLSSANDATAWVIVYEDTAQGVTGRTARAVVSSAIPDPLPPSGTLSYALDTGPLSGVDWSRLHTVAFIDYRPGGSTGSYDMLQACSAPAEGLVLSQSELSFAIDANRASSWSAALQMGSPSFLSWSVTSDALWLAAALPGNTASGQVQVSVQLAGMPYGRYQGHLTLSATAPDGQQLERVVAVAGLYQPESHVYLPFVSWQGAPP